VLHSAGLGADICPGAYSREEYRKGAPVATMD